MILVGTFLSNIIQDSHLGVYHMPPPFIPPICKLTAHSTGQCSQVRRLCSGIHQLPGFHRCGRTWDKRQRSGHGTLTPHPVPSTSPPKVSSMPSTPSTSGSSSLSLEQGHPHVLWVGQWAGTGLAVLRCSSRGVSIVARCTQLAELPSGVVLALLRGTRMSATCYLAKFTKNCTVL